MIDKFKHILHSNSAGLSEDPLFKIQILKQTDINHENIFARELFSFQFSISHNYSVIFIFMKPPKFFEITYIVNV